MRFATAGISGPFTARTKTSNAHVPLLESLIHVFRMSNSEFLKMVFETSMEVVSIQSEISIIH